MALVKLLIKQLRCRYYTDIKMINKKKEQKPDDKGNIKLDGYIKIFDPESKEVFVEKRS